MKKLLLVITTVLLALTTHAQNFPETQYIDSEMQLTKYDKRYQCACGSIKRIWKSLDKQQRQYAAYL